MKRLTLVFAIAIIFALGTVTLRSMLTGSPASNPGVSSPAPSVSAATNSARSALPSHSPAAGKRGLVENYGKLPLSFEANHGQTDPQVKFLSRGHGYALFLTGDEAVLSLRKPSAVSGQRVATVGVLPTVGSLVVGGKPPVRGALTGATSSLTSMATRGLGTPPASRATT